MNQSISEEFIRDVTQVHPRPKSEVWRRLNEIISQALTAERKELSEKVIEKWGNDGGPALVIITSHEGGVTQEPGLDQVLALIGEDSKNHHVCWNCKNSPCTIDCQV